MKRVLLLSLALLLTLMLLPTALIAAVGPKPKEKAKVKFGGDITSGWLTWDVSFTKLVIVYGDADLTLVKPGDFAGSWEGKGGIRIDKKTGRAEIVQRFGRYIDEDIGDMDTRYVRWPKYQLEGYGQWEGKSMPYGSVSASGDFKISQMFYTSMSKGKAKSATGVTFEEVWTGLLSFTIEIG